MSAGDVIPAPEEREPRLTQTGEMDGDGCTLTFHAQGARVVIVSYGGDIILTPAQQDLFARHLFRAMHATEVISAAEVPY